MSSLSSEQVKTIILVFGKASLILNEAVMPSTFGRPMSIKITSGWVASACKIVLTPSGHSATTRTSAKVCSAYFKPKRVIASSSAMSTLMQSEGILGDRPGVLSSR